MVYLYSGTPGSGKSLHTARVILGRLRFGHPVIANFDIKRSVFKKKADKIPFVYWNNNDMTPRKLLAYSREYFKTHKFREGSLVLIIDECQLLFNAREWQKTGRADWLSFFTQHRKYGYDIILVAQFDRMIDRQIRSLIEYEYIHRKISNFGIWGKIISILLGGKAHMCVQLWYPLKEKVGSEIIYVRKKYYEIYDSYSDFSA